MMHFSKITRTYKHGNKRRDRWREEEGRLIDGERYGGREGEKRGEVEDLFLRSARVSCSSTQINPAAEANASGSGLTLVCSHPRSGSRSRRSRAPGALPDRKKTQKKKKTQSGSVFACFLALLSAEPVRPPRADTHAI